MELLEVKIETGILSSSQGTFIVIKKRKRSYTGNSLFKPKSIKLPITSFYSLIDQLKEIEKLIPEAKKTSKTIFESQTKEYASEKMKPEAN